MTQTETKNELPDSVILPQKYNDADAELRKGVQALQAAYLVLSGIEELQPLPILQEIKEEWVRAIVEKKKDLVRADASLTSEERKQRLNAWSFIITRSAKAIATITNILHSWPEAKWKFDETICNYFCTNIEEVATAASTYHVPLEAKEHYRLIQDAIHKVRELRQWEDTHQVKCQPLAQLQDMPQNLFVEAWVTGNIKFDRRFQYLGINPLNYRDPQNPNRVII